MGKMMDKVKNMINGNGKKKKTTRAPRRPPSAVYPIKKIAHVHKVERYLEDKGKILLKLLWVTGTNCGLRTVDIVKLKAGPFLDANVNDTIQVIEQKTGKKNFLVYNRKIDKVFKQYIERYGEPGPDDWLFKSTRGDNHLLSASVGKKIRQLVVDALGYKNPHKYGGHTMRKTWAYLNRVERGVGIELLQKRFRHSSQRQTMDYACIDDSEVKDVMENPI